MRHCALYFRCHFISKLTFYKEQIIYKNSGKYILSDIFSIFQKKKKKKKKSVKKLSKKLAT